jgi:hypothetical protein
MARWLPKDNVGPNEHIGRRLFDEPMLFGATDQTPLDGIDLRHFEPTPDRTLSVDRAGDSCFHPQVQRYLVPRAEAAGEAATPRKAFHGWLTVPAKKLWNPKANIRWTVEPSPEREQPVGGVQPEWSDADYSQNRYHAHIPVPDGMADLLFAYIARDVFKKGKRILSPTAAPPQGAAPLATPTTALTKLQEWVRDQTWLWKLRRVLWGDE